MKKEVADLKSSDSAPPPAICLLWESLLVILGRQELRETDGVGGVLEWKFLRRFINVNPGQFDKESILFRMDVVTTRQRLRAVRSGESGRSRKDANEQLHCWTE